MKPRSAVLVLEDTRMESANLVLRAAISLQWKSPPNCGMIYQILWSKPGKDHHMKLQSKRVLPDEDTAASVYG